VGNLDDMEFIGKMSRNDIKEKSLEFIEDVGKGGGFILGGSESCVYTKEMLEGFLYMAEISEEYCTY